MNAVNNNLPAALQQIAEAVTLARRVMGTPTNSGAGCDPFLMERALLAEHERAERLERRVQELGDELDKRDEYIQANEKDAARWRAVRGHGEIIRVERSHPGEDAGAVLLIESPPIHPIPATVDEAADRLAEQENNKNE